MKKDELLGNKAHLKHIFHFQSGKTFIANAEEYKNTRLGTVARFSSGGDVFFLFFITILQTKLFYFSARKPITIQVTNNLSPR